MSSKEPEKTLRENNFGERPPEFDYSAEDFGEPVPTGHSLLLTRVLIVVINLAAIIFCRSFIQSWYTVHGTTPLWIPIIFLLVPLGSLFFIYFYMGRIGFERIIKLICLAFCALHIINFFSPIDPAQITLGTEGYSSDYSYVTQAGNLLGIAFPKEGSATTTVSITSDFESSKVNLFDKTKSLLAQEKLYSCTEVIYTDAQAEAFEKSLSADPVWLREIPEKLSELPFSLIDSSGYDFYLFFDCDGNSFNAVPESGKHTFYSVMYNSKSNSLQILKYTKKF